MINEVRVKVTTGETAEGIRVARSIGKAPNGLTYQTLGRIEVQLPTGWIAAERFHVEYDLGLNSDASTLVLEDPFWITEPTIDEEGNRIASDVNFAAHLRF